ncbi:MAG: phosphoribosylglycinamide formyltransferase [Rubrivivax sp.]|nr:phosphoribosylglycinamide formyltransferase [Rubrivivax sp.]
MKRIVILVSGRGSNARAIVQRCAAEAWPAQVVALVGNRPGAAAFDFAAQQGIVTALVDHQRFASRDAFDAELMRVVDGFAPDLVVLAGFMRILGDGFVEHYAGRLLNIHPSLLPAFGGLHTHRRAIEAGCKLAGATVHFVTPALDHGPIVAQAAVPVLPGDTPEALSARVLAVEHVIYPQAVRWFVEGRLELQGSVVRHRCGTSQLLFAG